MKFFKLELNSYEDRFEVWFVGEDKLSQEDFGKALSEAMLEAFKKLDITVEDSPEVRKDYPLFVLALEEDAFIKVMRKHGFRRLEPDVIIKGDSYSVLWETPEGKRRLTPRKDKGDLEDYLADMGVELSEEDPSELIFGEM